MVIQNYIKIYVLLLNKCYEFLSFFKNIPNKTYILCVLINLSDDGSILIKPLLLTNIKHFINHDFICKNFHFKKTTTPAGPECE